MKLKILLLALILALPKVHAALLVYEGFDYPTSSVAADWNAGTGFTAAWNDNLSGGPNEDPATILASSLSFTGLATSANGSVNFAAPTGTGNTYTRSITRIDGYTNPQTWVSFLLRYDTSQDFADADQFYFCPRVNLGSAPSPRFGVFGPGSSKFFGIGNSADDSVESTSIALDKQTTYFVVASIAWDASASNVATGNETISLFINPAAGVIAPTVADAVRSDMNLSVSSVAARDRLVQAEVFSADSGSVWVLDEIRFGTSFGDVAPIPEPPFLVGLAGVFLLCGALRKARRRTTSTDT